MAQPFAAYELIRKFVGNVEADVIEEARHTEQRALAKLAATGQAPSTSWVYRVAEAMKGLIESREKKVMDAVTKSLRAKPPTDIDEATPIQIANFVMDDLGRYYDHGSRHITHVANLARYIDGVTPNLSDHEKKLRQRITGEIEIVLAEVGRPSAPNHFSSVMPTNQNHVFVVHGRNEELRKEVSEVIASFGLVPVVLHEQPNKGRTIIEKFEDHANVGFAVVILSGDDVARLRSDEAEGLTPRPRQNVVLEFGFFLGRLGREKVCPLYEAGVKLPSDYDGVLYVPLDREGVWKQKLRQEIEAAGLVTTPRV